MSISGSPYVLCAHPSADFPEGFGLGFETEQPVDVQHLLRQERDQVEQWIGRFGLLAFFNSINGESQIPPRDSDDRFSPFHFDGCNAVYRFNWRFTQLTLSPEASHNDPTQFVPTKVFAHTYAERYKNGVMIGGHLAVVDLLSNPRTIADEAVIRDTYEHCPVRYAHPWGKYPKSSLLYAADAHPLHKKVLHGRVQLPEYFCDVSTPRLRAYFLN